MNLQNKCVGLLAGLFGLAALASACSKYDTRIEISDIMHETAFVSKLEYHHSTGDINAFPIYVPGSSEENNIWFEGIADFQLDNKRIFNRFQQVGQPAIISYQEVYKVTYGDTDNDGKRDDLISKLLIEYKFLDAVPK
jgi:hypothetical protein